MDVLGKRVSASQPLEITNGEIKTNADGKFTIEFEAIPDLSIDKIMILFLIIK